MQRYKDFQPTGFDRKNLIGGPRGVSNFFVVPVGHNRDSGILSESNWDAAIAMLGGESDTVQIHRFGHWACGWLEIILVDPSDNTAVKIAQEIESSLADYSILDEDDFSEREIEAVYECWNNMSLQDRIDLLHELDMNFLQARKNFPDDDGGRLHEKISSFLTIF